MKIIDIFLEKNVTEINQDLLLTQNSEDSVTDAKYFAIFNKFGSKLEKNAQKFVKIYDYINSTSGKIGFIRNSIIENLEEIEFKNNL